MNVSELIDTISQFAFGTIATERQREEYLRCLNFANNDLYLKIRNCINFSVYKEQKVLLDNNQYYFDFNSRNNIIKSIYNKNQKLNVFDLTTNDTLNISEKQYLSVPSLNRILLGAREFDKDTDGDNFVKLFYLDNLKTLVEVVSNEDVESNTHIYNKTIEQVLILGSLYYIYLGSNGQTSKITTSFTLYKEKLEDVLKFYVS